MSGSRTGARLLQGGVFLFAFALTFGTVLIAQAATPTVSDVTASMNEDTQKNITLRASGSRGETFTYSITQYPGHGTVTVSGSVATYTPSANWNGTDTFWWRANGSVNGASASAKATVTVSAVNDKPEATAGITVVMDENTTTQFAVGGTDVDGDKLTCTFNSISVGTLTAAANNSCAMTFTPKTNLNGNLTFYYRVSDGTASSDTVTVAVQINKVNDTPVANAVSKNGREDSSLQFVLDAYDDDDDELTYRLVTEPAHGTADLAGALVTYTPDADWNGTDTFTYLVNDGTVDSAPATVDIVVDPLNDAPVALDMTLDVEKNHSLTFTLVGTDVDGDALTYSITAMPAYGKATLTDTSVLYVPDLDFVGTDTLTFIARDGQMSDTGTVTFAVNEATVAPAAGVGEVVWQYDLGDSVVAGVPAVVGDTTYVSSANLTTLYAIGPDGALVDTLDINGQNESGIMAVGNRLVINTLATSNASNRGTVEVMVNDDGTLGDNVACVNDSNFFGRDGLPARSESGATIYTVDVQYPGAEGTSYFTVIDAETCTAKQEIALPFPGWGFAAPLFYPNTATESGEDGLVVIGIEVYDAQNESDGQLIGYAVDAQGVVDETPRWIVNAEGRFDRGATTITELGLIFAGTYDGEFYAVNPETGEVVWQQRYGGGGWGSLSIGADNRTLYAVVSDRIMALNAETGAMNWSVNFENRNAVAVVGDQGVYVLGRTSDGAAKVLALSVDGSELWNRVLGQTPVYGYMTMNSQGQLLFAAGDLYALQTESTGLATTSDCPSVRCDATNSGLPQLGRTVSEPVFDQTLFGTTEWDTTYCSIDGVDLKLDMHYPDSGSGRFPLLMYVHGGGWTSGDKYSGLNYIDTFNRAGYAVAAVNYRLAPTYKFPAPMYDLKCALRFLHAQADAYNLDEERFGMYGGSAGGHLVAQLATAGDRYTDDFGQYVGERDDVGAVILQWGVTDLTYYSNGFNQYVARNVFGATIDEDPQFFWDSSPVKNVDATDPAFMVIQGLLDDIVPLSMTQTFVDALASAGVPVTALFVENARHGLAPVTGTTTDPSLSEVMDLMVDFFNGQL